MTEFALILPILLLVVLGIIEAAWLIWAYITVQNAAREAARFAVTGGPLDEAGNPWSGDPVTDRLPAIINQARSAANGLPIARHADWVQSNTEGGSAFSAECTGIPNYFDCYMETPGALGVMVRGQRPDESTEETTDVIVVNNHPGEKGLNVEVEVYYNARMLDPIYNVLLGGNDIRLVGRVVLQNEGLNLALGDLLPPQSTPVADVVAGPGGAGGDGTSPFINVNLPLNGGAPLDEGGAVPAGSPIDIFLNLHPLQPTYVCIGDFPLPGSPYNVLQTTQQLPTYTIPEAFLPGSYQIKSISTTEYENGLGCAAPNIAAFEIQIAPVDRPVIAINDGGHEPHAWPDNSLVSVRIAGHDPDNAPQTYQIYLGSPTPGNELLTDTGANCAITTSTDGFAGGTADCVLPNNSTPGDYILATTLATTTVEIQNASITLIGGDTWPNDTYVNMSLADHAPGHVYYIFKGNDTDGYVPITNSPVAANDEGRVEVSFYVPLEYANGTYKLISQDRDTPLPGVSNRREIAALEFTVNTPTDPFITVSDCAITGTCRHRAGTVIDLRLRNHSPSTDYDVKMENLYIDCDDNGGDTPCTTGTNGNTTLFSYRIPISYQGVAEIASYLKDTNDISATREIEVLPSPYIAIEGGNQHAPGERITVSLHNHLANASFNVYLDLDSDGLFTDAELVRQNAVVNSSGAFTFTYDIPLDIQPTGTEADQAHAFRSVRSSDAARSRVAEENLFVVEADLSVTAVIPPSNPQPGLPIPISIVVANTTSVTITNQPFDTDLYFETTPSYDDNGFPPGEDKVWLNSIAPNTSVTLQGFETTVYDNGSYLLYGRTDTSDRIVELMEFNNILSSTMVVQCSLDSFADTFDNGNVTLPGAQPLPTTQPVATWSIQTYGDAALGAVASADLPASEAVAMLAPQALPLQTPQPMQITARSAPQPAATPAPTRTPSGGYVIDAAVAAAAPKAQGTPAPGGITASAVEASAPAARVAPAIFQNAAPISALSVSPSMVEINPEQEPLNTTFRPLVMANLAPQNVPLLQSVTTYNFAGVTQATCATNGICAYASDVDTFPYGGSSGRRNSFVQATNAQYVAISADNTAEWVTADPGNNDEIFVQFDMAITENISAITQIDFTFSGNTDGANNVTHRLYVKQWDGDWWQNASWDQLASVSINQDVDTQLTGSLTANFADYINPTTGAVTWGVYTTRSNDDLRINYAEMRVTSTPQPEMDITGNGVSIVDGDTTPSTGDHTDFGSIGTGGGTVDRTFTIQNTGDANLTLSGVTVSGANAGDFTVTTQPASPVSGGGSTTFVVRFAPTAVGARSATLSIANNDSNENPYTFAVSGDGVAPVLAAPINLAATVASSSSITVNWQHPGAVPVSQQHINASFNSDTESFVFTSLGGNTFAGESGGSAFDSGVGNPSPGSLKIKLGGNTTNSEGYWQRSFILDGAQTVNLSFQYRATFPGDFDADEYLDIEFLIDGVVTPVTQLTSSNSSSDSVDTGWQTYSGSIALGAGSHTLRLSGYNNKSTTSGEVAEIWFDAVNMTGTATSVLPNQFVLERAQIMTGTEVLPDGLSLAWSPVVTVPYANPATRLDTGLACRTVTGPLYFYRVRGYLSTAGVYSEYSNIDQELTDFCAPFLAPTQLNVVATTNISGETSMALQWVDNSNDETEYRIERAANAPTFWEPLVDGLPANTTTFVDDTACGGAVVYYRVIGYRASDGATVVSTNPIQDSATSGTCPTPTPVPTSAGTATPAPTATALPRACTNTTEAGGTLSLCSSGSGMLQANDAGAGSGYVFFNRAVNSPSFEMFARLVQVPNQNLQSRAGLEVRDSLDSNAPKVSIVVRNQSTQQVGVFVRSAVGGAVTQVGDWTNTGGDVPTWLRIVRANGRFYFYYNASSTDKPVPGAWVQVGSVSVTDGMDNQVFVGMVNASASATRSASEWQNFALGCTAQALSLCGPVSESDGLVVLDAINYTDNYAAPNGDKWAETSNSSYNPKAGMMWDGSDYTAANLPNSAPMLEYLASIQNPGTYYVWVLGYTSGSNTAQRDSRDTVHVGVNGNPVPSAAGIDRSDSGGVQIPLGSYVYWFNGTESGTRATINLQQGLNTINVWGGDDDFHLVQLLLTNNPAYVPSTTFPEQSDCLMPVPPVFPPRLQQCANMLKEISFEDSGTWRYVGDARRSGFPYPDPATSWSATLPTLLAGAPREGTLIQSFTMPSWLDTEGSIANLDLFKAVHKLINPDFNGVNSPNDKLTVALRVFDGSNVITVTEGIVLADGDDNPADNRTNIDPSNPDADSLGKDDWIEVKKDLFDGVANLENYAGMRAEIVFSAPNPGLTNISDPNRATTNFYLDKVDLEICTTEPRPPYEPGTGSIEGQLSVFLNGAFRRLAGVKVWAYKVDGPVHTTFSINSNAPNPNYSFYNLEPGLYFLYAEFKDTTGLIRSVNSTVTVNVSQISSVRNLQAQ